VVVVGRSLAAVVDLGGGRSVVVESRENAIPNLILFSFSFLTHSHFPSLSLVLVAVVPRGGGCRSFFGGGGRRWYRSFGGGRADASFARAAPVPSHSHSVLRRLRWSFGGAFNNLRWTLVPTPWWSFSNLRQRWWFSGNGGGHWCPFRGVRCWSEACVLSLVNCNNSFSPGLQVDF